MNELVIANTIIHKDAEGRYCLNDLHRAAGAASKHQPSNWLRLDQTKSLCAEIDRSSEMRNAVEVLQGGPAQGTYVAKELVYAYAMWISPAFHLKVIRAYDAMVSAPPPQRDPMAVLNDPEAMRGLLLGYSEKVIALEGKVGQLAPKAEALDRFSAFAEGSMCISNAAKALQMQPKALFRWLQLNQWIFRRAGGSGWLAYQARIQVGYLEHKVTTVERGDGSEKVVEQVLVTAKGLARLSERLTMTQEARQARAGVSQ